MRRVLIACAAVLLVGVACSSNDGGEATGGSSSQAQTTFALEVASSDLYVGAPQRVDVGIFGSTDQGVQLLTGGSIPLSLVSADGGDPISGTATYVAAPGTRVAKQPSLTSPQVRPRPGQVRGTQTPHTFAVPAPPQVSPGTLQSPQLTVPPQPSEIEPQFAPAALQSRGSQH